MKEIVTNGVNFCTCTLCMTSFYFEKEDIIPPNEKGIFPYIVCPHCKHTMKLGWNGNNFEYRKRKMKKKGKVFISGKVSGLLYAEAKYKFDQVEDFWRNKGFEAYNPTNHCKVTWSWLHCMVVCLWNLTKCDMVVFLDNWKDSRGARIEHKVAKLLGKTIIE